MSRIFIPVWMEMLVLMKKGLNMHQISVKMNRTYAHIHNLKKEFEVKNWIVDVGLRGRERIYTWTDIGNEVVYACKNFLETFVELK